jgi:hypothetical protein
VVDFIGRTPAARIAQLADATVPLDDASPDVAPATVIPKRAVFTLAHVHSPNISAKGGSARNDCWKQERSKERPGHPTRPRRGQAGQVERRGGDIGPRTPDRCRCEDGMASLGSMRKLLVGGLRLFLLLAVLGHYLEHLGVTHCGCAPECWCKRPGLSFFRWVIPWGHRFPVPDSGALGAPHPEL